MIIKTRPSTVLKSVGPKLVPFFKTVAIHFVLFGENGSTSLFYCVVKCLPIVSLIVFVLLHGMNFSYAYSYSRRIILGLVACIVGDALLVWQQWYFLHGIAAFAIGQALYTSAFGLSPFNPYAASFFLFFGICVYFTISASLEGLMVLMVPVYITLITTMGWRAIARLRISDEFWSWTHICRALGAGFFLLSDFLIAIDKFRFRIPYAHTLIMVTYYAAQLGITLSVVDSQVDAILERTSSKDTGFFDRLYKRASIKFQMVKERVLVKLNTKCVAKSE